MLLNEHYVQLDEIEKLALSDIVSNPILIKLIALTQLDLQYQLLNLDISVSEDNFRVHYAVQQTKLSAINDLGVFLATCRANIETIQNGESTDVSQSIDE